jgi:type III restriction enzyme
MNELQSKVKYDFVYVDQEGFNKYKPSSLKELVSSFKEYK